MVWTRLACAALAPLIWAAPAAAQNRVTWEPSYSGSCENCQLSGLHLSHRDFSGANYPGADMTRAVLQSIQASGANFTGVQADRGDFSYATLTDVNLSDARLSRAVFTSVSAAGANFTGADLDRAGFDEALLVGANFAAAQAVRLSAEGADFSGAHCAGADFTRSVLRRAVFDGANLQGAVLIDADIAGASFRDARFDGADLSGVSGYENANFDGACGRVAAKPAGLPDWPDCEAGSLAD